MPIECLITFCIFTNCCVFGGFVFWAHKYSRLNVQFIKPLTKAKEKLNVFLIANIIMEQVSRILLEEPAPESSELNSTQLSVPLGDKCNDRLLAVVAGGNLKKYFGKEYTITDIENISVNKQDKLFARYEAKLEFDLITDLEKDPFISTALFSANHRSANFGETFQNKQFLPR